MLAISDHPWTRVMRDAAVVRIAMTVAAAGPGEGRLVEITLEAGLDTDEPVLDEREAFGRINTLEGRPRYPKWQVFDPFLFPDRSDSVTVIAERLDATRRAALAESPALTMTGLYNLVAAIQGGPLPPEQDAAATRARAFIVAKLHGDRDRAVADAYGWGADWARAPLSPGEIVRRPVALNAERAAEEAAGTVRWLRPDYPVARARGVARACAPRPGLLSARPREGLGGDARLFVRRGARAPLTEL